MMSTAYPSSQWRTSTPAGTLSGAASLKYKRPMIPMMNNTGGGGGGISKGGISRSGGGIKLNLRKISIRRLRARFYRFFRFLNNHIWRRFLILKSSCSSTSSCSTSTTTSSSSSATSWTSSWDSSCSSTYVSARPSFSSSNRSLGSAFSTIIGAGGSGKSSNSSRTSGSGASSSYYYNGSRSARASTDQCRRSKPLARSNSFYAEAIADCIEFIKRSSTSTTTTATGTAGSSGDNSHVTANHERKI